MEKINAQNAPAAVGPYSHAVVCGNIVFTSGQIPLDANSGEIVGSDVTTQATQVMKNLDAVLQASGSSLDEVIKSTCFLADMGDFAAFNAVYEQFIQGKPARSCVAVKTLPKNVLVEVEVIAEIK